MATLALAAASGCGSSGMSSDSDNQSGGSGASYAWVAPPLNRTLSFTLRTIDNSSNTIDQRYTETVTSVNADGSFTQLQQGQGNQTAIVNGTNYSVLTETIDLDDSGRTTSYSYTNAAGVLVTCVEAPHGLGPSFPLRVGASWSLSFTISCNGSTPITYTQQGAVDAPESVTVAAGTFSAIKLLSTVVWTDPNGTTHTETLTNWRDVVTLVSVQETTAVTISGTVPTVGYAVSSDRELQTPP